MGAELARLALLSVRRMASERFRGEGGRLLLTGNAMHADVSPEAAGSGLYGFVLAGLAQQVGYPVPRGGAQAITDALVSRLTSHGGTIVCGAHVDRVIVRDGRAVGIEVAGDRVAATRAVLADTDVVALYRHLVGAAHLPARTMDRLTRFERGPGTVKVDWALVRADPVARRRRPRRGNRPPRRLVAGAHLHGGRARDAASCRPSRSCSSAR